MILSRFLLTLVLLGLVIWWLLIISGYLTTVPTTDKNGAIVADPLAEANKVLAVFLPTVTTALGYWFGVAGKEKVEEKAEKATAKADALFAAATPQVLDDAMNRYPAAFVGWK